MCRWQQRRLEDSWALQMGFRTGMQMVEWKLLNSHLPLDRCRALDALISARKGAAAAVGRQSVGGACGVSGGRRALSTGNHTVLHNATEQGVSLFFGALKSRITEP